MTWSFDINNSVLSTDESGKWVLMLRDLGVANNYLEVLGSGDGRSAFENTGQTAGPNYDVLTGGVSSWNSGVDNEWSNTNAWIRLRMVGTTLEFLIQRAAYTSSSYEDNYLGWVSPSGGFSSGGAASTRPTATDEQQFFGTGTSTETFGAYNYNQHLHIAFNDEVNAQGFRSFYVILNYTSGKAISSAFFFDAIDEEKSGDTMPWVIYAHNTSAGALTYTKLGNATIRNGQGYYDYGGAGETFANMSTAHYTDQSGNLIFPRGVGVQPEDSKTRSAPIVWGNANLDCYKGVSSFMEWKGSATRVYPDTVDLTQPDARCYFDDVLVPWPQNVAPI